MRGVSRGVRGLRTVELARPLSQVDSVLSSLRLILILLCGAGIAVRALPLYMRDIPSSAAIAQAAIDLAKELIT